MKINHSPSESAAAAQPASARTTDLVSLGRALDSFSPPGGVAEGDSVSLSGVAAGIEASIRRQSIEREERIEALRLKVASGTYSVDAKELSSSILRHLTSGLENS